VLRMKPEWSCHPESFGYARDKLREGFCFQMESLSLLAADYVNVLLMSEMSHPGKDHRHTVFIGRGDNLIVFDGTAGLDH
jgi:hypothetical protein